VTWRIVGAALCLAAYGFGWVLVVAGAKVLIGPLVVVPVLVFLIAAGNWLQHWLGITRPAPKFRTPERQPDHADGDAGTAP
jgi:hypothetical protein